MSAPTRLAKPRERGAALILTIVVIMILTTLALTMAAFTVTEERTATTYRDSLQTRQLAEAGARAIQEMFINPDQTLLVPVFNPTATGDDPDSSPPNWDYWGADDAAIETKLNEIGIWREARSGANPPRYTGAQGNLFQGPFKDSWERVFGGLYESSTNDHYDLKFNCTNPATGVLITNAATKCWLDTKINALLLDHGDDWNLDSGKITDISLYAPPIDAASSRAFGLATVRVTAIKTLDGQVVARETIEAVMVDVTPKPAVLGNGDIVFKNTAGTMCGNGCEQIHANGNADVGSISGGQPPMVTATGTVTGGSGSTKPSSSAVETPRINPWDLEYRPRATADLAKYYLAAARPLDPRWTNVSLTDNDPPRPCGYKGWSRCQDYGLEYSSPTDSPPNADRPRTAANVPALYKWDSAIQGWKLCSTGVALTGGVACLGAPTFSVTRVADQVVSGTGDLNDLPYAKHRVPKTIFQIGTPQNGATVLVDGMFKKHTAMTAMMTIIAVGSIDLTSASTWGPGNASKVMWVSGRDIDTHANCCAPSNTCATNLTTPLYSGVIASHEQFQTGSQNALLGVLIAENRVNYDTFVDNSLAINSDNGDHGSLCNDPDWPWTMPVNPAIASMKSAAN